jgi:predicted RNA binding protein YcfA (HicA-like mRNA interferase family)
MPKLPRNIKPQKLIKILKRNGFEVTGKRGSHFRLQHADGRWTQVAVHPKPIPQGTLRKILSQSKLSPENLR